MLRQSRSNPPQLPGIGRGRKPLLAACGWGHEFTPANTRVGTVVVKGKRYRARWCRACKRVRDRFGGG